MKVIKADKKRWVDTMMQEEHGISGNTPSAFKAGLSTLVAFLLIGGIPFLAYFVDLLNSSIVGDPFFPSCILTGLAFFAVGAMKSRYFDQHWSLSGFETLGIGALAAGMAYGIGLILRPFAEDL